MSEDGIIRHDKEKQFAEGVGKDFNLYEIKDKIENAASSIGLEDLNWRVVARDDGSCIVLCNTIGMSIRRDFYVNKGVFEVHHELFTLDEEYQGKGFSKTVLASFYRQYLQMGVEKISVTANIDVGGYCWAKYGFKANTKEDVIDAIYSQAKPCEAEALKVVNDWYKKNGASADTPFPMNELLKYPWGKDLLMGSLWDGHIDLKDAAQTKIFEEYLGLR